MRKQERGPPKRKPSETLHAIFAPLHSELNPQLMRVEVATQFQIPTFHIIGLAAQEIRESAERIRSAISHSGFEFPHKKVTVNLSPAGQKKSGTSADLAIALAVLSHSDSSHLQPDQQDRPPSQYQWIASGELSLMGEIQSSRRVFRLLTFMSSKVSNRGSWQLLTSNEDAQLANDYLKRFKGNLDPNIKVIGADNLREAFGSLMTSPPNSSRQNSIPTSSALQLPTTCTIEMREVRPISPHIPLLPLPIRSARQFRAVIAAAVGNHHLLLVGPKGTGKTQSLNWIKRLRLNDLKNSQSEHLCLKELLDEKYQFPISVTDQTHYSHFPIRELSTNLKPQALTGKASAGKWIPGELNLANEGILIANEFSEWPRDSRELLRGPLEQDSYWYQSAEVKKEIPCRFQFLATSNLCPCGGELQTESTHSHYSTCRCSASQILKYLSRLSGPILDRIDLVFYFDEMNKLDSQQFTFEEGLKLFHRSRLLLLNSEQARSQDSGLPGRWSAHQTEDKIRTMTQNPTLKLLYETRESLQNPRVRHKVTRVASTLAAMDGVAQPESCHITEALHLRFESVLTVLKPSLTFPLVQH